MNQHRPFQIFALVAFIGFLVPMGIQDGMFMDGQIYACVARNLAHDFGTFWFPKFSQTFLASYHEQLPLFFGMQAAFFKLFGDSLYVERSFSFVMACAAAFLITRVWRFVFRQDEEMAAFHWLPVLLWITIPTCFWAYINNLEETVMALFAMASIYLQIMALESKQPRWHLLLVSGFPIFFVQLLQRFSRIVSAGGRVFLLANCEANAIFLYGERQSIIAGDSRVDV